MSNKEDLVVDLLQEVRQDQKEHSVILIELKNDVSVNTKDLAEHIEGVTQNRARIVKLEEPRKAFGVIKEGLLIIGSIAAAFLAVLKFLAIL